MTGTQFDGGGPVARYWLANCKGFEVTGDEHGVVEELIRGVADPHQTARLVVRTRSRRRRVIAAEEITLVVPAEKVLVVERRRQRRQQRSTRVVPAARVQTRRVIAAAVPAAHAAGGAVAAAAPPTKRAVVDASKRTGVLARRAGVAVAAAGPPARRALAVAAARMGILARRARLALAQALPPTKRALAGASQHVQESWRRGMPAARDGAGRVIHAVRPALGALAASCRAFFAELRGSARLAGRSIASRRSAPAAARSRASTSETDRDQMSV
jgi:hypothetical protein